MNFEAAHGQRAPYASGRGESQREVCDWIREWLHAHLGVDDADPDERLSRYGLNSLNAASLLEELGRRAGRQLRPTLVWERPSIQALSEAVAGTAIAQANEPVQASLSATSAPQPHEPIAIVGMACRLPGAPDIPGFWDLLENERDCVREVPSDRWDADAFYDADRTRPGKANTRWGGFLEDVSGFDAEFFGISPREAVAMDPQQRLLLEVAWECVEDAGVPAERLRNSRTGVFVGAMWNDYARISAAEADSVEQHTATGLDSSILSARVSYSLGLQGPSLTVNSACSSSLACVHLACQSLHDGETDAALAGGVNLLLAPESTVAMSKFGGMAPDGLCKPFSDAADGYVRAEGCGLVLLKRLSRAIADNDRIYCVIRGSAVNNDGFSNGLTSPNPAAQRMMLEDACRRAGVNPADVDYVEAHGTGTALGDPIEAGSLGDVLGRGRQADRPLWIGSVKSNVGHLEAAAGIAGLIKTALAIEKRTIPASLHADNPNHRIPFAGLGIRVARETIPWPDYGRRALAGVSSFGFGGTNAHLVLEEYRGNSAPLLAFVYPGSGWAGPGMGCDFLSEPEFRKAIEECQRLFAPLTGRDLMTDLTTAEVDGRPSVIQPVAFAWQVAMTELLRVQGTTPDAVLGHSLGEVTAAWAAGILSLPDAVRIVSERSLLLDEIAGRGEALAVGVAANCIEGAEVAAFNSPETTILAGETGEMLTLAARFESKGVFCRILNLGFAAHTRQTESLLPRLEEALAGIHPRPGRIPMIATAVEGNTDFSARYWVRNLREPVRFSQAIMSVLGRGISRFLEIASLPVLSHSIRQHAGAEPVFSVPVPVAVPVSARSEGSLEKRLQQVDRTRAAKEAYTWGARRAHHEFRAAILADGVVRGRRTAGDDARIVFVFPGQGGQSEAMGARLQQSEPVFREAIRHYAELTGRSKNIQPRLFVLQMALAELWRSWGIRPAAVIGHSMGEVAAACVAGAIRDRDAARIICARSARLDAIRGKGGMALVELSAADTAQIIEKYNGHLCVAAHNGPRSTVISGEMWAIDAVLDDCREREVFARQVDVDVASHSPQVNRLAADLEEELGDLTPYPPRIPVFSTITGGLAEVPFDAQYWAANLRKPVRFREACDAAKAAGLKVFLELSPHPVLAASMEGVTTLSSLRRDEPERAAMLKSAAALYCLGHEVRWDAVNPVGNVVSLPPYPWQRQHYWPGIAHEAAGEDLGQSLYSLEWKALPAPVSNGTRLTWAIEGGSAVARALRRRVPGGEPVDRVVCFATKAVDALRMTAGHPAGGPRQIWFVTDGRMEQAEVWGLARSIAAEQPDTWGGIIEIDPAEPPEENAARLASEIGNPEREDQIRYRGKERFGARLSRLTVPRCGQLKLCPVSDYLITGGLGDLGLLFASRLAERGARSLILTSRSGLPERRFWRDVNPRSATGRRIAAISALEKKGVKLSCPAVDVADREQMETLRAGMAKAPAGIIHAAGTLRLGSLDELEAADLEAVIAPKAKGARLLDELFGQEPLEFFVLFSSFAQWLGSPRLGAYAAANAYLQAFAEDRRRRGLKATAICWGFWDSAGMAAREGWTRAMSRGVRAFSPESGLDVFERLVAADRTQAGVMPVDWRVWAHAYRGPAQAPLLQEVVGEQIKPRAINQRRHGHDYEALVRRELAQVLRIAETRIDALKPFQSHGLDSLMALELRRRLEGSLGIRLKVSAVFNYPTVQSMARHLHERAGAAAETSVGTSA